MSRTGQQQQHPSSYGQSLSVISPQYNKAMLQRLYREKESESFKILGGVIKGLTGEELRTRQEILKRAIDLLVTISEMKDKGNLADWHAPDSQPPHETHVQASPELGAAFPDADYPQDMGFVDGGCPVQVVDWNTASQFSDVAGAYYGVPQSQDQQYYHFPSATDSASNNTGEDSNWSDYQL